MAHPSELNEAADLAVKKVFFMLGVDVEDPASVEEFRQDLRFSGKLRRMSDQGAMALIGLAIVGLMTALWHGIVTVIKIR